MQVQKRCGLPLDRGLHSSTSKLNVSTFCEIWGLFRGGIQGQVEEVFRACVRGV